MPRLLLPQKLKAGVPVRLTLAGLDEEVRGSHLDEMASWPNVELGFHFRAAPERLKQANHRRWLAEVLPMVQAKHARAALHLVNAAGVEEFLQGRLDDLAVHVARIKIGSAVSSEALCSVCDRFPDKQIITAYKGQNQSLLQEIDRENHAVLFDETGLGFSRRRWFRPETDKAIGFIAKLAPDQVALRLDQFGGLLDARSWIELKEAVFTATRFDFGRARDLVGAFEQYTEALNARSETRSQQAPSRAQVRATAQVA